MMKMIKGETLEEQMKHVDRILKQYSLRLHKTVTSVVTPFPISSYKHIPADDDAVLRYMFPISGKIIVGGIFIDSVPKNGVDITTILHQGDLSNSRIFFSKRQSIIVDPNIDVNAGDRLIIKVRVVKPEESVLGIWTAFTWAPEVKDAVIKQFLIKDLENNREAIMPKERSKTRREILVKEAKEGKLKYGKAYLELDAHLMSKSKEREAEAKRVEEEEARFRPRSRSGSDGSFLDKRRKLK